MCVLKCFLIEIGCTELFHHRVVPRWWTPKDQRMAVMANFSCSIMKWILSEVCVNNFHSSRCSDAREAGDYNPTSINFRHKLNAKIS